MSEYFGTDPLWTWVSTSVLVLCGHFVKNDDWCDPSSAGTLTRVKTIETCVESAFATVYVQSAIAGYFLLFWWGRLGQVALHQVTWTKKLNNKLKVGISPVSKIKPKSESFTIPFYGDPLNSARSCVKTAVTAAVVTDTQPHRCRSCSSECPIGFASSSSSSSAHAGEAPPRPTFA
jgi:hypothetical protein